MIIFCTDETVETANHSIKQMMTEEAVEECRERNRIKNVLTNAETGEEKDDEVSTCEMPEGDIEKTRKGSCLFLIWRKRPW